MTGKHEADEMPDVRPLDLVWGMLRIRPEDAAEVREQASEKAKQADDDQDSDSDAGR